jgi:hypothetical protein
MLPGMKEEEPGFKAVRPSLVAVVLVAGCFLLYRLATTPAEDGTLRVAVFLADATPPLGSPVAYAAARKIEDPLSARGIVLLGAGKPIVLCAVDWIGISNEGHDAWREALAEAAGTTPDRVAVHALHQHDGPRCDFGAEALLEPLGLGGKRQDSTFLRETIARTAKALESSLGAARPVTHLGVGRAKVEKIASNRRILGPDGRVAIARSSSYRIPEPLLSRLVETARSQGYELSATRVEEALAAPEGVIDPEVKMVTFYEGDSPIVSLSYYATHPQSHFGLGDVTSEFVGLARAELERSRGGIPLIHFTGGGGNVAAGKYNDGTPESRIRLTERMSDGLRRAWASTERQPIDSASVAWRMVPVALPLAPHLDAAKLRTTLEDTSLPESNRLAAAGKLAYVERVLAGHRIDLTCLKLGRTHLLHMPGELFVEYQLAAQEMKSDGFVSLAAYGDGGPGYIGTEISYAEGGYETQPSSTNVAPEVEGVLLEAIGQLLK